MYKVDTKVKKDSRDYRISGSYIDIRDSCALLQSCTVALLGNGGFPS